MRKRLAPLDRELPEALVGWTQGSFQRLTALPAEPLACNRRPRERAQPPHALRRASSRDRKPTVDRAAVMRSWPEPRLGREEMAVPRFDGQPANSRHVEAGRNRGRVHLHVEDLLETLTARLPLRADRGVAKFRHDGMAVAVAADYVAARCERTDVLLGDEPGCAHAVRDDEEVSAPIALLEHWRDCRDCRFTAVVEREE